jgi:hypothetical protein
MSSALRGFHTTSTDSYYVVTDVGLGTSHLFAYKTDSTLADISTGSGFADMQITAAALATGSVLLDMGYEVYEGTTQFRKVALV